MFDAAGERRRLGRSRPIAGTRRQAPSLAVASASRAEHASDRAMASVELERGRRVRRVLLVTLGLNLSVAGAKIAYGYAADSLSIRADGFHSLTDGANN